MGTPLRMVTLLILVCVLVLGAGTVAADDGWREIEANATIAVNTDSALTEEEIDLLVNRSMVRIEEVRAVEFAYRPDVRVVSRDEAMAEIQLSTPSEQTVSYENTIKRGLFYVDEVDVWEARNENRNVTVGGFYRVGSDEIVLVSDEAGIAFDEITLAHELLHAWQDQQYDLGTFSGETRDERSALLGLIEGDAVFTEILYEERCASDWDCVQSTGSSGGTSDTFYWGIYFADFHPYSDGPLLIAMRYEAGGWDAVNEVYADPPTTTRHLLEPDTYGSFDPVEIDLEDSHSPSWERLTPSDGPTHARLGPGRIAAMFLQTPFIAVDDPNQSVAPLQRSEVLQFESIGQLQRLEPFQYEHPFTDGWHGDRFHAYERGVETGYVWRISWESEKEATQFAFAYDDLLRFFGAEEVADGIYVIDNGEFVGAYAVTQDEDTITLVGAPDLRSIGSISGEVAATVDLGTVIPYQTPLLEIDVHPRRVSVESAGAVVPHMAGGIGLLVAGLWGTIALVARSGRDD